jgi:hypothetical protein
MHTEFSNYIMITDRHFIAATHNTPHNNVPSDSQYGGLITGYCINFIKPNGSIVSAQVACWATNSSGLQGCYFNQSSVLNRYYNDVAIGKLSSPITDPDIKIYKFAEFKNLNGPEYVPRWSFPVIIGGGRSFNTTCLDNAFAIALNECLTGDSCQFFTNKTTNLSTASSLLPERTLFFPDGLYSGDSGNPIFILYNNDILLASLLWSGGGFPSGPNYTRTEFLDEVQNVIDNQLGADGTIQRVNLWSDIP